MSARTRSAKLIALAYLLLSSATLQPSLVHSQDRFHDVPSYAHYSATEQGWTCNDGFRQVAGFCVGDDGDMPSQGPFELFDGQWRCRFGYQRQGRFCVTPKAPEHATVVEPGGRWECDWGYRKVTTRCEEINPPPHAYLDASGQDWTCYPGFQRDADHCVPGATGVLPEPAAPAGTDEKKSNSNSQDPDKH